MCEFINQKQKGVSFTAKTEGFMKTTNIHLGKLIFYFSHISCG